MNKLWTRLLIVFFGSLFPDALYGADNINENGQLTASSITSSTVCCLTTISKLFPENKKYKIDHKLRDDIHTGICSSKELIISFLENCDKRKPKEGFGYQLCSSSKSKKAKVKERFLKKANNKVIKDMLQEKNPEKSPFLLFEEYCERFKEEINSMYPHKENFYSPGPNLYQIFTVNMALNLKKPYKELSYEERKKVNNFHREAYINPSRLPKAGSSLSHVLNFFESWEEEENQFAVSKIFY